MEPKEISLYQIARVRAQERVRDNEMRFKFFVDQNIGVIIPQGTIEQQREFAAKATELGRTHTFNALDVYRKLVEPTWLLMGGSGQFTPSNIADIYGMFRLLTRRDLNIFRFKDPEIGWMLNHHIAHLNQLAEGVRDSVNQSSGHTLISKAINKQVYEEAALDPIARMVIPVVVLEVAPAEIAGYEKAYDNKVVVVDLKDAKSIEDAAINSFTQLKTKFNK